MLAKNMRLTNLKDKYKYETKHSYYQVENFPQMPGLKSATARG